MHIHIVPDDTFVDEFITNSAAVEHYERQFWVDTDARHPKIVSRHSHVVDLSEPSDATVTALLEADKIFVHGLTTNALRLLGGREFAGKCIYWMIWGADLYQWLDMSLINAFDFAKGSRFRPPLNTLHSLNFFVRKKWLRDKASRSEFELFLDNVTALLHYNEYDTALLNKQYERRIPHIHFFYKNLIDWEDLDRVLREYQPGDKKYFRFLLGNSATITNNHFSVLRTLGRKEFANCEVFVPLSYGDKDYGDKVSAYGQALMGDRYHAITDYMNAVAYSNLLLGVDAGIMNHIRSQGMGNIIVLLYLGKLVYLHPKCSTYVLLKDHGFTVFSTEELGEAAKGKALPEEIRVDNRKKIRSFFSDDQFLSNLRHIYELDCTTPKQYT